MRYNEKDVAFLAKRKGQLEGRLQYRAPPGTFRDTGFRERYFRLVNNLLFYFRFSEFGQVDFREPVGVLVLENYSVRLEIESDLSFEFGILFLDEPDKRHVFTARSDVDANLWVNTLRQASYQHWKDKLQSMMCNIQALKAARNNIVVIPAPVHRMTEEANLLDLDDKPRSTANASISRSKVQLPRHNPFLPVVPTGSRGSPKPPPRNYSSSQIDHSNNNDDGSSSSNSNSFDLIKF